MFQYVSTVVIQIRVDVRVDARRAASSSMRIRGWRHSLRRHSLTIDRFSIGADKTHTCRLSGVFEEAEIYSSPPPPSRTWRGAGESRAVAIPRVARAIDNSHRGVGNHAAQIQDGVPPVLPPWETLFSALRAPRQRAPRPRRRRSRSSSKDERRCGRGRRRRRLRRRRRRVRRGPPLSLDHL